MAPDKDPFRTSSLSSQTGTVSHAIQEGAQEGKPPLWLRTIHDQPALTDKFRHIKHHLNALKTTEGMKIFAFTAPHGKAGVSTLTSNLGLVMSYDFLDQRILLVDAHLGLPSLDLAFGIPRHPGLLDYLIHGLDLSQVSQSTFRPNLDVIASGIASDEVASPFDLKRFADFLEDVRQHYDFILVDCPPVFAASDAQIICGKVDGVAVIAEANRLRYEVLLASLNELGSHVRLVGCIFNKRQLVIPNFLYRFV